MLANVFGITRFHTYLIYGRHFKVVTDHRPLVMIVDKPLHKAPPRLQRMLYKIQGYDFQLTYKPGNTMVLSDTLSRLPYPKDEESIPLDERVDGVEWTPEEIDFDDIDLINFTRKKQEELWDETDGDHSLCLLKDAIIQGRPETIKEVPTEIRYYWSFRDELGVENGIIFKGPQVVIPSSLQKDILPQLHKAHQGIEKTRLLTKESVFWQNMMKDITEMIQVCEACPETRPANHSEPLTSHEITQRTTEKTGHRSL